MQSGQKSPNQSFSTVRMGSVHDKSPIRMRNVEDYSAVLQRLTSRNSAKDNMPKKSTPKTPTTFSLNKAKSSVRSSI